MGPKGGFSCFVFKQLYESKQLSKLMRLGEEFPDELATFLKLHPDLLWLHEVFLHQFSSASETLHALSLSKDDSSVSIMEGTEEATGSRRQLSLASRKHFLNLAKISAMAARDVGYELKVRRIDADLNILQLQEKILTLLPDEEKQSIGEKLLPPIDLIELCLRIQHPELSLRAFDLFLWTSASFLRNNTSLLEDCWRNAAKQDDWGELYQRSLTEGWSDERTIEELKETVLFQASSKFYGPDAETFDGIGFNEVLPLRLESPDDPDSKYANSSVEAILMQHKDYPEAGKLMLFALMVGSEWSASSAPSSVTDYEGSSPMK